MTPSLSNIIMIVEVWVPDRRGNTPHKLMMVACSTFCLRCRIVYVCTVLVGVPQVILATSCQWDYFYNDVADTDIHTGIS